jgi:hypothetical protein
MGEMERSILDARKKGHEAIVTAISDLDRMGYLVSGVSFKDGALEVICYPPAKKDGKEGAHWVSLGKSKGYGTDESSPGLSMDGVSETFTP